MEYIKKNILIIITLLLTAFNVFTTYRSDVEWQKEKTVKKIKSLLEDKKKIFYKMNNLFTHELDAFNYEFNRNSKLNGTKSYKTNPIAYKSNESYEAYKRHIIKEYDNLSIIAFRSFGKRVQEYLRKIATKEWWSPKYKDLRVSLISEMANELFYIEYVMNLGQ